MIVSRTTVFTGEVPALLVSLFLELFLEHAYVCLCLKLCAFATATAQTAVIALHCPSLWVGSVPDTV